MKPAFRCPHCGETLLDEVSEFRCRVGHAFDRAKEGYVNLLPGGRLKGSPAGDDDSMVRARRRVFDAGLYLPIIDRVAAVAAEYAPAYVLDVGCGEGSYLAATTGSTGAEGWGIDISKAAVKLASRRNRHHHYAVASSYALPFADGLFDVAINVFSPREFTEMRRVLGATGVAIVVTPGPDHLRELKATLYDVARRHVVDGGAEDRLVREESLSFDVSLTQPDRRLALLRMTPFWWSATTRQRDEVADTLTSVTVDMHLSVYAD